MLRHVVLLSETDGTVMVPAPLHLTDVRENLSPLSVRADIPGSIRALAG
jgi:hypothetical protein